VKVYTRLIPNLAYLTYVDRLKSLNLPSLYYRCAWLGGFTSRRMFHYNNSSTKSNVLKFQKHQYDILIYCSFATRVINDYHFTSL